jgi:hypothetical protein
VLGHLLLKDLLKHGLDALAYPGFDIPLNGVLELLFLGRVPPSSLNPQTKPSDAI